MAAGGLRTVMRPWRVGVIYGLILGAGCTQESPDRHDHTLSSHSGSEADVEAKVKNASHEDQHENEHGDHDDEYSEQRLLAELIEKDKQQADYLNGFEDRLNQLCQALYTLRTGCPLLTHIITRQAQVVNCSHDAAESSRIFFKLILGEDEDNKASFDVETVLEVETRTRQVFKLKFPAHQVVVSDAKFISESQHKHHARVMDISKIALRRDDGQPFRGTERRVWLSFEVNGEQLLFDGSQSGSFGVDNEMRMRRNHQGFVERYEMSGEDLARLNQWREHRQCQPNIPDIVTNNLPSSSPAAALP